MVKRVAIVLVIALVGAGCAWLKPRPWLGPVLAVHVGPPAAAGVLPVDITAGDLPDGTAATTTVRLDKRHGRVIATGSTLPLRFTVDPDDLGAGGHVFYVRSYVNGKERRGLGLYNGGMRLNQLQAVGTHNSYHVQPVAEPFNMIEAWQYFQDPLDVQLESQGVRQFELDVNISTDGSRSIDVFHIPVVDMLTTCSALADCLRTIKGWSDANPSHAPIAILLEIKDNDLNFPVPYGLWQAADLDHLDATIRTVFSEDDMFTPDDLRRGEATLPAAIAKDGWPLIDEVRGQVMFMMDNAGTLRNWYRDGHPGLAGRVIFTNATPGADDAAFIKRNDSIGQHDDIQSLVAEGYVVRTRTDSDTVQARVNDTTTRDAAIDSGAQWVSSDFVVPGRAFGTPYVVQVPGGTPARCNPINTPGWCTSNLIESLP